MHRPEFEIGETNILCTDASQSLRFYQEVLGFEYVEEDRGAHRLRCGRNHVLLLPIARKMSYIDEYGAAAALSFDLIVDDLKAAYDYFCEQGIEIVKMTDEYLIIRDPDGVMLEVIVGREQ